MSQILEDCNTRIVDLENINSNWQRAYNLSITSHSDWLGELDHVYHDILDEDDEVDGRLQSLKEDKSAAKTSEARDAVNAQAILLRNVIKVEQENRERIREILNVFILKTQLKINNATNDMHIVNTFASKQAELHDWRTGVTTYLHGAPWRSHLESRSSIVYWSPDDQVVYYLTDYPTVPLTQAVKWLSADSDIGKALDDMASCDVETMQDYVESYQPTSSQEETVDPILAFVAKVNPPKTTLLSTLVKNRTK
jgi:hypothetical protein